MPRTAVVPSALNRGAYTDITSNKTTIDSTLVSAGVKIKYDEQDQLTISITNTYAGAKTVTFKASESRFAFMRGQGDYTVSMAQNKIYSFNGLEQWRFKQADGYIYIDFESGFTGTIEAFTTL